MPGRLLKLNALDIPLALFLLSAVVGVGPAYDRSLCWPTLIALTVGFLSYLLISRIAISHRWWYGTALALVTASVLLSLCFVIQLAGGMVQLSTFWFPQANSVATFVEGTVFVGAALVLTQKRRTWRVVGGVVLGLMVLTLILSDSRGAWLAVAVAATLWLSLYWRPVQVVAIAAGVLVLGLIGYVIVRGDVAALGDIPIAGGPLSALLLRPDRLEVYRNSVYLIQDFPLTGIGLGRQFGMVYSRYALLIQHLFLTYSHNLYLEVWLEQGLLGITALLWLMAALYQAVWTHKGGDVDPLFQSAWIGITVILVHGVTDARQFQDLWCWLPFFALLGLTGAILLRGSNGVRRGRCELFSAVVVGAFLLVVVVVLFPWSAAYHANQGCLLQARAELAPSLDEGQRAVLQQQAADHYRRAIRIDADNRTARQRLGLLLVEELQFEAGVEHLEVAWQADPGNTTTHKALGLAYVWVGDLENARPLLLDVRDIVKELNVWGWWWGTEQQMEQSLNAYRMSLLLYPNQPEVQERVEQLEAEWGR
jgi:O-antigen ligase